MDTWIKLYRKLTQWEWYTDSHMVHVFIHLLLNANIDKKNWRGIKIDRGQVVTGRKKLSEETGIPERTIRTCLNKLRDSQEIAIKSTNQFSIITICKYDDYQPKKNSSRQRNANGAPTSDHTLRIVEEKNKEIYMRWREESKDQLYIKFLSWLLDEDLPNCMSLDDHIDEVRFIKIHHNAKRDNELIKQTISNMENKPDLKNKYTSFYRTLDNWIKMEIKRRS